MAKDKLTDHWTMKDKKVVRIARKKVEEMLKALPIETVAAHLDLEGFCYIKVVRTGAHEGFAQDSTQRVLTGELGNPPMTVKEIGETFWKEPAMVKWGKPSKEKKHG